MRHVAVVQRVLPHYRHPFFQELDRCLREREIVLTVFYGQEYPGTVPKTVNCEALWAQRIDNRYLKLPRMELVWQPCLDQLNKTDLVIVEQANRLLLNYALMLRRNKGQKLAFFGHGKNFQARTSNRWREVIKRSFACKVDWWFAYTELSAKLVGASGFAPGRITVVQNAIDTDALASAVKVVMPDRLQRIKDELNLHSDNICLYCGGMYPDKKLRFLLDACDDIRAAVPDFHMIFLGDGPDQHVIEQAARRFSWVKYLGPKFGLDRAPYFLMSKALLMPGSVGLAIVDSFVTQTPLFTTDLPSHGPEIAYLENNVTGVMTEYNKLSYASAVIEYLRSSLMQTKLRSGCELSAKKYTLGNMVENFASGIAACLEVE